MEYRGWLEEIVFRDLYTPVMRIRWEARMNDEKTNK